MAITKVAESRAFNTQELQGLSTDTKPSLWQGVALGNGSSFLEIDTGKFYVYDTANAGATNGWWYICLLKTQ